MQYSALHMLPFNDLFFTFFKKLLELLDCLVLDLFLYYKPQHWGIQYTDDWLEGVDYFSITAVLTEVLAAGQITGLC